MLGWAAASDFRGGGFTFDSGGDAGYAECEMPTNQPKISLCAITGNCERDIERFLDAFQPHVDEIVIVRAIGSAKPDQTLAIAQRRDCLTGHYLNAEGNEWPHVDNFAAARNKACSLASHEWIIWADLDDTAEGLEHLREIIANLPAGTDVLRCPYVVTDQGVVANYRERVWRNNGEYEWANPLHENLVRIDRQDRPQAQTDRIRIIHAPRADRDCSKDRNLRILEAVPEADRTHSHTFYLLAEYARRKDARAVELAQRFLAHPEGGPAERFECCMILAAMAEDHATKAAIYVQAFAEDPSRAEPLYELTGLSLAADQPERALAFAKHMMTCQWPERPCWNHRKMFYGFFRADLHLQAMRAAGQIIESDTRRNNAILRSGLPTISLLHATRGRPIMALKTRMEWLRMADHPERIEHLFAGDADDETAAALDHCPTVYVVGDGGPVAAWNAAARQCKGHVLVQLSDDWRPTRGWDTTILDAIGDLSRPAVLAIDDGHRTDGLLCMAILTRARFEQQGYLFHPEFFSMFSDNWFSACAWADGVVIDARDRIKFEHDHPFFRGETELDATYARSNHRYHYQTGHGILCRLREGIATSHDVEGWCDYRALYAEIAKALPDGATIVEVGSWQGQSIIWLCQRLQDLGKKATVHCIDTWRGDENEPTHQAIVRANGGSMLDKFLRNIDAADVSHMIRVTAGDSAESAAEFEDASADFVFIDAAHDYESVRKDVAAWYPKLKPGGIWAGHDYPWHEVERAVNEHAAANGYEVTGVGRCWLKNEKAQS